MTFTTDMRLLVARTNERWLLPSRVGEKHERTVRENGGTRPLIASYFVYRVSFIIWRLWFKQKWAAEILGFSCVLFTALQQLLSGEDMRPASLSSAL